MARRPASLKVRALQWLAQREHSPAELRAKLLRLAAGLPVAAAAGLEAEAGLALGLADEDGGGADEALAESGTRTRRAPPSAELQAEVDALITWLATHKYLSTERFVESRVNARQSRYGNQRITRELQQHGLQLEPEAKQALKDSELSRAREVWGRKYGQAPADAADRVRQMRFLAGRGFSHEVVRRVVRSEPGADDD